MDKEFKKRIGYMAVVYFVLLPAVGYLLVVKLFHISANFVLYGVIPIYLFAIPQIFADYKFHVRYRKTLGEVEFSQKDPKTGSDWIVFKNYLTGLTYLNLIFIPSFIALLAAINHSPIIATIAYLFAILGSWSYYKHLIKMKYMGKP